jgi:beta-1,4-mannooligosaccharide/beta-1,4-mannosyl-N-acetylglucosamine phosphorylase
VVPFKDGFAGVFRCDDTSRRMNIHAGRSKDGFDWAIADEPIGFIKTDPALPDSAYKYDPRVVFLEDRWYIIWCNGYFGPCIGLGYTFDFEQFYQMENTFMPYNRNAVLFPRKIGNNYAILSRPSDSGHTPFGDIIYSESPDLVYWGRHRHVMSPAPFETSAWQCTKIGAGPAPIETAEGWLLFYHGVLTSCNGFVYSFGAALLDLDRPWQVIARSRPYLISPQMPYELSGDVPNVTFPCAALADGDTDRIAVYYGCADTVTSLAFGRAGEIVDFIKQNPV